MNTKTENMTERYRSRSPRLERRSCSDWAPGEKHGLIFLSSYVPTDDKAGAIYTLVCPVLRPARTSKRIIIPIKYTNNRLLSHSLLFIPWLVLVMFFKPLQYVSFIGVHVDIDRHI